MIKLDEKKLEGLTTFDDLLNEKYGPEGSPEREEFERQAELWYYALLNSEESKDEEKTPRTNETFSDYDRLKERLELFRTLEEGWDLGSARAPEASAIKNASDVLKILDENILHYCALFPSDGGIYFTGKFKNGSKSLVHFSDNKMSYVFRNKKDRAGGEDVKVTTENIRRLRNDICRICL